MPTMIDRPRLALHRLHGAALGIFVAAAIAVPSAAHAEMQRRDVDEAIQQYLAAHPEALGPAIEKYLADHPEAIRAALVALIAKRNAAAQTAPTPAAGNIRQVISDNAKALYTAPLQTTLGAAEGARTLVEFYDFNCGYCRKALGDTLALIADEPNVRIVLKELPILGHDSVEAAKVAIALQMHHPSAAETLEFHRRLMATQGRVDRAAALAVAADLGFNAGEIEKNAASAEVSEALQQNMRLASALGINGTPGYLVGDSVIPGAVGAAALKARIQSAKVP
ncbi:MULTISPECIES: DsbA family protein [unclassified Bradyrhizobium]|uniref:DsbA family protein n=1 Tax=unclassified Bradyrhizobium TaxID=2631580 RepID=UPI00211EEBE5|nr:MULTISPECIES: DsbA family protein [unclassified Bradyrhizobium]